MANIEERINAKGELSYRVKIRIKGAPTETATFKRKTDARRWIQQTEAAIREGRHFKTSEAKRRTLAELIDRYVDSVLPHKPKSMRDQKRQLTWWRKELGSYSLAEITPPKIVEARDKLLATPVTRSGKKRSPSTVVRYMAALSHAFTVAVNDWGWLDDSPMRKVSKPKEDRGRVRYLSDDERARLLSTAKEHSNRAIYPVVVLALATGMRQGEILNLRWSDIDLTRGRAILHETKNGERRAVPLVGMALEVVKELSNIRHIDTDLLFPASKPKYVDGKFVYQPIFIRKAWREVVNNADIEDFRFHDLRHSAASYLAMSGATLSEIAEVLGHKTLQMVKRYSHPSEDHLEGVVAKMNRKVFGESK